MSACDIVELLEELGILEIVIVEAGDDFGFYDKDELAEYLTVSEHFDVVNRLLGSNHEVSIEFNEIVNGRLNA